jgi:hypothetical protein
METRQRTIVPENQEQCYTCGSPTTGEALTCICTECGKRQYDLCHCGAIIARTYQDCPVCGIHRYKVNRKEIEGRQSKLPRLLLFIFIGLVLGLLVPRIGAALYYRVITGPSPHTAASSLNANLEAVEVPDFSLDILLENIGKGLINMGLLVSRNWLSLIGALVGTGLAIRLALKSPPSSASTSSRRKPAQGKGQNIPVNKARRKSRSHRH